MKILVVEECQRTAEQLAKVLTDQHHVVDVVTDGQAGWDLVEAYPYNLLLLDVMLPKLDGINFCQKLRHKHYQMPALLLTAQYCMNEKVRSLDAGADDYMVKPFVLPELLAQIRCLLRRSSQILPPVLVWGGLSLDSNSLRTSFENQPLDLTPKQYCLLELFLRYSARVLTRSMILEHLWSSYDDPPGEDAVKTHIKCLRQKLRAAGAPSNFIQTIYGLGYQLKPINE